jgi:C-22 sterol desaturase
MASYFRSYSPSASMPSSTAGALSSTSVPSFLNLTSGPVATWLYTTGAVLIALLVLEQSVYRQKKQHLPGDKWTIPLVGKFADSMKPTMEGYKKQWDSGALSAISVFNM